MSPQHSQYQAYSVATRTVAKTRQVVMLYDGAIRFLKQAQLAIEEKRIEDRFKLLLRASEVIVGLQSNIDFENGGDIANTLHKFYTNMSTRILSINFAREDGYKLCEGIIEELKQMRDVWENIDRSLSTTGSADASAPAPAAASSSSTDSSGNVTLSA